MKLLGTIFILLVALEAALANDRSETGIVHTMENYQMVLDYASGSQGHIGFLCEPEICELTRSIYPGDEVLITLGALDGKTKLLNIRKCTPDDMECLRVAEEEIEQTKRANEASVIRETVQLECQNRMENSLRGDSRNISENWFNRIFLYEKYTVEYYEMLNDPASRQCVKEIGDAQFDAFIDACEKHGCGDNIGGGCYHIAGYTSFEAAKMYAVKKCRN